MPKMDNVKCPHCGHEFNSSETFAWMFDENGHPTIEYVRCPKCQISTDPMITCEHCPGYHEGKFKCNLEEMCAAAAFVSFDAFVVVA